LFFIPFLFGLEEGVPEGQTIDTMPSVLSVVAACSITCALDSGCTSTAGTLQFRHTPLFCRRYLPSVAHLLHLPCCLLPPASCPPPGFFRVNTAHTTTHYPPTSVHLPALPVPPPTHLHTPAPPPYLPPTPTAHYAFTGILPLRTQHHAGVGLLLSSMFHFYTAWTAHDILEF